MPKPPTMGPEVDAVRRIIRNAMRNNLRPAQPPPQQHIDTELERYRRRWKHVDAIDVDAIDADRFGRMRDAMFRAGVWPAPVESQVFRDLVLGTRDDVAMVCALLREERPTKVGPKVRHKSTSVEPGLSTAVTISSQEEYVTRRDMVLVDPNVVYEAVGSPQCPDPTTLRNPVKLLEWRIHRCIPFGEGPAPTRTCRSMSSPTGTGQGPVGVIPPTIHLWRK